MRSTGSGWRREAIGNIFPFSHWELHDVQYNLALGPDWLAKRPTTVG